MFFHKNGCKLSVCTLASKDNAKLCRHLSIVTKVVLLDNQMTRPLVYVVKNINAEL